ncbi:MAG TPA: RagB/SusD family nutrient uptake outer membrane protein [Longimicrobiales bacterium]|nr:RagB/SusD family nutrient uptake outer membrane protein [Longimicrobiales bacterium]
MKNLKINAALAAVGVLFGFAACDVLDVTDPQRYTDEDLDNALDAVAAGAEGDLYITMDQFVIYQGLLGDELQHTGTWAGYDDIDHGRFNYGNSNADGNMQEMLRARFAADDAEERFIRVLGESEAATSPLTVQVQTVSAMADLTLGMMFCEAPAEAAGPAVPASTILAQAESKFTRALATAQTAGEDDWALVNYAGRARARLYLENYSGAADDASMIPDGWVKNAQMSANSGRQDNDVVQLITAGNNAAAAVREKWWPSYDETTRSLLDPYTNEPDPRKAVYYPGTNGVDGVTPHYSQWKYQLIGDDIPFFDSEEMRLIEAEVAWVDGDLGTAQDIMNDLRNAAGLSDLPATTDPEVVKDYLLNERLAETWMEGHRVVDLRRLGELADVFEAMGDPERPTPRPAMFSMDDAEARDNPEIEDNAAARCLPMTS